MTSTKTPEITVTVVGPNGVSQLEVHAAGCADLNRPKYRRSEKTTEKVSTFRELVESWYVDMIGEDGESTWEDFTGEFKVFPCVGHLPTDEDEATRQDEVVQRMVDSARPAKARKSVAAAKAAQVPPKRTPRAKVGVYPEAPAKLTWASQDGVATAQGVRHTYRITRSEGHWYTEQRLTKGGHWVHVAGSARTRQRAEKLAGMVEAGATWLSYATMVGVAFEDLPRSA